MPPNQDLAADFHVFSVVWSAQEVTYYLDRKRLRTVATSRIPTHPAPPSLPTRLWYPTPTSPTGPSTPQATGTAA